MYTFPIYSEKYIFTKLRGSNQNNISNKTFKHQKISLIYVQEIISFAILLSIFFCLGIESDSSVILVTIHPTTVKKSRCYDMNEKLRTHYNNHRKLDSFNPVSLFKHRNFILSDTF